MNRCPRLLLLVLALALSAAALPANPEFGTRLIDGYRELLKADARKRTDWPKPEYPLDARQAREECAVVLRVFFSAEGKTERVQIEARVGSKRLAELAAENARRTLSLPTQRLDGDAIRFFMDLPVVFALEGSALAGQLEKQRRPGVDPRSATVEAIRALSRAAAPAKK